MTTTLAPSEAARRRWAVAVPRDVPAVIALTILTVAAMWAQLTGGTETGQDAAAFFYPMFSFLGRSLRAGQIPVWNPHQLAGTPFAGDPQSGWMYFPAMVLFSLLSLPLAAKAYLLLHPLIAGLGMYALARVLGLPPIPALLSAVAFEFSSFLYERNICCFAYSGVYVWLPLIILGAELAIRSVRWRSKLLWLGVSGFALGQVLSIWLGQGSYYALLALGGYVAYRTLFSPPPSIRSIPGRLVALVTHGALLLLFGFGLAAAGLLPRIEYNLRSNLALGYSVSPKGEGGWGPDDWAKLLNVHDWRYAGGAVVALAVISLLVAHRRAGVPYWALLSLCTLVLAGQGPTPLHWVLYHVLPGFARLHPHVPERVLVILYLGLALMAGATLAHLFESRVRTVFLVLVPVLGTLALRHQGVHLPHDALVAVALVVIAIVLAPFAGRVAGGRTALSLALVLVVMGDLWVADHGIVASEHGFFAKVKVDLSRYYDPGPAGRFLLAQQKRDGPFRYYGYDPALRYMGMLYRFQFAQPVTKGILVNNRATVLGLQDVQGYDPIQLEEYVRYMEAVNGGSRDYRGAHVYPDGIGSPLLDLLNARYVVVPDQDVTSRKDLARLEGMYPTVFDDGRVKVLENLRALPRAWIVHSARKVSDRDALRLLASGRVDPRRTALLSTSPPRLSPGAGSTSVRTYEAGRIMVRTHSTAPGLLMLSEIYYPAWHAYVDGTPVRMYRADYALRAVPVPAGEHTVVLGFESGALKLGLLISLATYAVLMALAASLVLARRGTRGGGTGVG